MPVCLFFFFLQMPEGTRFFSRCLRALDSEETFILHTTAHRPCALSVDKHGSHAVCSRAALLTLDPGR